MCRVVKIALLSLIAPAQLTGAFLFRNVSPAFTRRPLAKNILRSTSPSVWDNSFGPSETKYLRDLLLASDVEEKTSVIDRQDKTQERGPVASALESWIDEFGGDSSRYIEWWWRDEWLDFEAHRDVSELEAEKGLNRATSRRLLRFPNFAHVLYLSLDSRVQGPTCVWGTESPKSDVSGGFICPAVEGRVLRFKGDQLHSVPRPALRYLQLAEEDTPSDDHESIERGVILFNTWDEEPLDVEPEGGAETGWVAVDENFMPIESVAEASTENPPSVPDVRCRPRLDWKEVTAQKVTQKEDEEPAVLSVPLLGDRFRRVRKASALTLIVPKSAAEALTQPRIPTSFPIFEVR